MSLWSGSTARGPWRTAAPAAATNEQFTYAWPLACERHSINHTSAVAAVGFQFFAAPLPLLSQPPSAFRLCLVSKLSVMLPVFPCSRCLPPPRPPVHASPAPTLPITFSPHCFSQHLSIWPTSSDAGSSNAAKTLLH